LNGARVLCRYAAVADPGALDNVAVAVLARALGANNTLTAVDLTNCALSTDECDDLATALEANHTILALKFEGNRGSVNAKGFITVDEPNDPFSAAGESAAPMAKPTGGGGGGGGGGHDGGSVRGEGAPPMPLAAQLALSDGLPPPTCSWDDGWAETALRCDSVLNACAAARPTPVRLI